MAPTTRSQGSRGLLQCIDLNQKEQVIQQNKNKGKKPKKTTRVNLEEEFEREALAEEKEEAHDWSSEDFEILSFLGEGAQSRVVKGLHKTTGKVYAIKQIDCRINQKYAIRELAIHSSLDHPGIVTMHGHYFTMGREDNEEKLLQLCLILEYCPQTLLDKIKSEGRLQETEAAQMLLDIVDVLSYLHKHNIIHRDIKLANVLLTSTSGAGSDGPSAIKMADFGIAVRAIDPESRKTIIGTQGYTAPEINLNTERTSAGKAILKRAQETGQYGLPPPGVDLFDSQYTAQVDLWSLGVTLHAMLTGIIPGEEDDEENSDFDFCFDGDRNIDLEIPDYLSNDCASLLEGLLEEDPQKRLTLDEVRTHPWVISLTAEGNQI
jgi:serine/threonine protein kinase